DARSRAPEADLRYLSLALAGGVLLVHAAASLPSWSLLLVLSLPALLPWRGRLLWSALVLGVVASVLQAQTRLAERWPAARHGAEVQVRGHVVSLIERSPGFRSDDAETLRFVFQPLDPALPARLRVSWYRAEQALRAGECWRLQLRVRTPHGSLNPGAFDYEAWLYRRGIGATATVRSAERCDVARYLPILATRQRLIEKLDSWLGAHSGKAMIAALTVGDTSGFRDADWTVFRETGTSHLVAISGFNVAILAGLAYLLLRWTWPLSMQLAHRMPAQKVAMIAAAVAGLAYGLLAGWESPAQRAAMMLALLLIAALPDRQAHPSRVLAAAFVLMLLFDPSVVLSPGLWLSCGAVAAIFYVSSGRLGRPSAWRLAVHLQLMLSLILAPLTLYFFHGAAWLGPLVNLIAVPVMAVLTPLVLAAVALAQILPALGIPLLEWVADLLHVLQQALAWVALHAPRAWMPASPPTAALALAVFGAVLLFAPRGVPLRALGALCFAPLLLPPVATVRGPFELTALDVGQGLAVLVRTPNHTLLYDAGPAFEEGFDAGESVVAPYVLGLGLRSIDRLFLSHGDRDHSGGVEAVRRLLHVKSELGTDGYASCVEGQSWTWDGVLFEVLHPDSSDWSDNNRSCVLHISAPEFSALLSGDIERGAEARLVRDHSEALRADVLIAPHHGSKTSSTPNFVHAVAPQLVVFGAGWRSHYGHPRPEVVARYREVGARPLTTGVEGAVRIWSEDSGAIASTSWRREAARFWNAPAEP
ncbi:MAG: DNA internalization-related competence protein ComEC/Rec2, partial [Panacagrimonas sp.]